MSKNSWHQTMYDDYYASITLDSDKLHKMAAKDVEFLYKTLGMNKYQTVLDLPCGTGRHSHLFAKKDLVVTGVDISKACLQRAKKNYNHQNLKFIRGDMANLGNFVDEFDYVFNLYTSFGYFDTDEENERVLLNMVKCLKNDGRIVIQQINKDWLLKNYESVEWSHDGKFFLSHSRKFNHETQYNESNLIILNEKTGLAKRYYHRVRCYSQEEMFKLFEKVGLSNIEVYGDSKGGKFDKYESSHPYYIGTLKS